MAGVFVVDALLHLPELLDEPRVVGCAHAPVEAGAVALVRLRTEESRAGEERGVGVGVLTGKLAAVPHVDVGHAEFVEHAGEVAPDVERPPPFAPAALPATVVLRSLSVPAETIAPPFAPALFFQTTELETLVVEPATALIAPPSAEATFDSKFDVVALNVPAL